MAITTPTTAAASDSATADDSGAGLLEAPGGWRTVEFISDLHLHAADRPTFLAWQAYLQLSEADAVFILGDLFEVWIGDDAVSGDVFLQDCATVLTQAARQRPVYFMHGNRDFLVGGAFLDACGMVHLPDPCVFVFAGQRWLLSHGDALCLDDAQYQQFRTQVRSPGWQQDFLAQPLAQRRNTARELRNRSEARKRADPRGFDVDTAAARQLLLANHAQCLIHGHTHRPADHILGDPLRRVVLSDWDALALPPRGEVLRLSAASAGGACPLLRLPASMV